MPRFSPLAKHIEHWPLDRLIPYANNPRTHSDAQVTQIAASIQTYGFVNPILIAGNGGIIAGHGRLLAARQLNLPQVPVIILDYLTEAQKRAYIIADNQIAMNAGWDEDLLRLELAALKDEAYNLDLIGFDDEELGRLLAAQDATQGLTDPDAVPEVSETSVTVPGDLSECAAFAVYSLSPPGWRMCLILIMAPLIRETGLILTAGFCLHHLLSRQWRIAALGACTAIPCLGWYVFVAMHSCPVAPNTMYPPLTALAHALVVPAEYRLPGVQLLVVQAFDVLALSGMLVAVCISVPWILNRNRSMTALSGLAFAFLIIFVQADNWQNVFSYGREFAPLLLWQSIEIVKPGVMFARLLRLAPTLMLLPRVLTQLTPEVIGVASGIRRLMSV